MSPSFDPRHFGKSARNEQRKLLATTANTLGLAVFGIGFVTPAFSGNANGAQTLKLAIACAILVVAHMVAQRILRGIRE